MHGHGHPKLAKKLNDKIPKTVDEMFERVRSFIQGEMAAAYPRRDTFTPLTKTLKEILAMEGISFSEPPPLIGIPKKQNLNKFCDYHRDRGHNTNDCYQLKKQIEEVVASGKLAHLVRDIRRSNQKSGNQRRNDMKVINMIDGGRNHKTPYEEEIPGLTEELTFSVIPQNSLTDEPIILEGTIEVEEEELASLMGYRYKCFLWLPKDNNQIRMAEDDEEKTGFHTEEGVYCFTHMPKGLKNSAATLQRMMEKALDATNRPGWTNKAEKAFQKIRRKLNKLQNLTIPKEGEVILLCLCQGNETISFVLFVERNGIQAPISYVSRPLQGIKACYTPTKKMVQALIHTTRSLRTTFKKHKVRVVTDGSMEEMLKLSGKEGRLAKWTAELRKYDISFIQEKEVEG
ncbi:reverse transcriptase domain-containing protein [Tanacetum coccineum]